MGALHERLALPWRRRRPQWKGEHCSVLRTDVVRFSAPARTDEHRRIIRSAQYEILHRSFDDSGISWDACYREDRGDGALIVMGPDVTTEMVIDPFVDALATRLSRYNAQADAPTSIQLRAALDVGPVKSDAQGVNGEVIIRVSQLIEAPDFKQRIAAAEACLGFITSPFVYDKVIKQRPGHVDPADYEMIDFWSKESMVTGWMSVVAAGGDGMGIQRPGRRR